MNPVLTSEKGALVSHTAAYIIIHITLYLLAILGQYSLLTICKLDLEMRRAYTHPHPHILLAVRQIDAMSARALRVVVFTAGGGG